MGFQLLQAPAVEPVSVAELAAHLRIIPSDEDTSTPALLASYAQSAREWAETFTARAFVTQRWRMYLDAFPGYIDQRLGGNIVTSPIAIGATSYMAGIRWAIVPPFPPCQSIDALNYLDPDANPVTMVPNVDYLIDIISNPARVTPMFGKFWPISRIQTNSVWIDYTAGYANAAVVHMTAGSPALGGATFPVGSPSPAVGQALSVIGAGPGGATLVTTIASVDGEGNATAAQAAATAVTGATAFWGGIFPESIRNAIKMLAGHWYENRENSAADQLHEVPMDAKQLLYPYRDLRL